MMHSNDFVVAVSYNGQFLQESAGGVVSLPFNSEYSLRLRNKHNRRAVAKIFIDNESVAEGGVIVPANSYLDLDCHVSTLRKFKFVSSDSGEAVQAGKNNKSDDSNGVVRVEWQLEREPPVYTYSKISYKPPIWPCSPGPSWADNLRSVETPTSYGCRSLNNPTLGFSDQPKSLSEGCTVEGGASSMRFRTVHLDLEPAITTIQLTLKGYAGKLKVSNYCQICCEKFSKRKPKFCPNCGAKV
jgi:hypothetical protein